MQKLKDIGAVLLGILIIVGILVGSILIIGYGSKVAIKADPILSWISLAILVINLITIPLVIFKRTRAWYGLELFFSSMIYGLSLWVYGFLVTYILWGIGAVVVGIFILGIGVVPFGLIASVIHHEWSYFWNLILMLVLTFASRGIGSVLVDRAESDEGYEDVDVKEEPLKGLEEIYIGNKAAIKASLSKVKNAGQNTEIIGWLAIAVGAIAIWLQGHNGYQAIAIWFIYLIIGLYFIYSGKYIRYARGKHIAGLLLLNGFLLLALTPGIFPLIVSIQSFVNYGRYRKLKNKFKPKFSKHPSLQISTSQAIVFVVLILAGILSIGFKFSSSSNANTSAQSNNATLAQRPALFTASNNNFSINFPGTPTTSSSSQQVSGYTVPITTYDSQVNNGSQEYDVYVYNWPSQGFDFSNLSTTDMQTTLKDSASGIIQAVNGKSVNDVFGNYDGHISLDSQFTTKISGNSYPMYLRVFFVGNNEYGIASLNSSQGDFNSFANSFSYTGQ